MSQSAKGALHFTPQTPSMHEGVPFVTWGHTVPQLPQLSGSDCTLPQPPEPPPPLELPAPPPSPLPPPTPLSVEADAPVPDFPPLFVDSKESPPHAPNQSADPTTNESRMPSLMARRVTRSMTGKVVSPTPRIDQRAVMLSV